MDKYTDLNVEEIDEVTIDAHGALRGCDLMSPYVWEGRDGLLHMLLRGVHPLQEGDAVTGVIFHGTSKDGLHFDMDEQPVIAPSSDPDAPDHGGCEDPTVIEFEDEYVVYDTGVERTRTHGVLLYATGPGMHELQKQGVAHASTPSEGNVKEATIAQMPDGRWRLFYEYAHKEASLIGLAIGSSLKGPWEANEQPFEPRPGRWDNWHLSTGPMLRSDPDRPIMIYNGATRDARWRIGWVMFNKDCTTVLDRCIQPLITPPPAEERSGTDIAFAASAIERGPMCHLYYSVDDRCVVRALVRRS